MKRTDYEEAGFARRFAGSRVLTQQATVLWATHLRALLGSDRTGVVLDIGAGTGRFWPVLHKAWRPEVIVAVDRSCAMLQHGPPEKGVLRVCADIDSLPLASRSADAALCSMSLHYSRHPSAACKRLGEALRSGGVLAIRTGTRGTLASQELLRYFPTAAAIERAAMPEDHQVVEWLVEAGFTEVTSTLVVAPATTYWAQLRRAARRGFPSLQLISRPEFLWGLLRFSCACLYFSARRQSPPGEAARLVAGKCP